MTYFDLKPGMRMRMGTESTLLSVTMNDCVFNNGTIPTRYILSWIHMGSMKILTDAQYEIF